MKEERVFEIVIKMLDDIANMKKEERHLFFCLLDRNNELFESKTIVWEELYSCKKNNYPDWINCFLNSNKDKVGAKEAIEDYVSTFLVLNEEDGNVG